MINRFLDTFGALRGALVLTVVFLIVLGPIAGGELEHTAASVLMSVVAPAFYVVMLFVLPLDITMSFVFMSDKEGEERMRFRRIIRVEVVLFILMVLAWLPFIYDLLKTAL